MSPEGWGLACPECGNRGVIFTGKGLGTRYKVCPLYKDGAEPEGHPSRAEVETKIRDVMSLVRPSGRFA